MKIIIYLLPLFLLMSCMEHSKSSSTIHSETRDDLKFTFEAHSEPNGLSNPKMIIKLHLTNIGDDTLCFYEGVCGDWINDNPVNLHYFETGIQCLDTLSEIVRVAPKQSVYREFDYYIENESDLLSNISFGVTCYPVNQNFKLTPENEAKYMKNRKKLIFKPAKISILH